MIQKIFDLSEIMIGNYANDLFLLAILILILIGIPEDNEEISS
jgi:hypothetical protein